MTAEIRIGNIREIATGIEGGVVDLDHTAGMDSTETGIEIGIGAGIEIGIGRRTETGIEIGIEVGIGKETGTEIGTEIGIEIGKEIGIEIEEEEAVVTEGLIRLLTCIGKVQSLHRHHRLLRLQLICHGSVISAMNKCHLNSLRVETVEIPSLTLKVMA